MISLYIDEFNAGVLEDPFYYEACSKLIEKKKKKPVPVSNFAVSSIRLDASQSIEESMNLGGSISVNNPGGGGNGITAPIKFIFPQKEYEEWAANSFKLNVN